MPRFLRRALPPLLILAAAIVGFLVLRATGPEAPAPEATERTWPVQGLVAELGEHHPGILLNGRSASARTATLRAAVEGEIEAVPARIGARMEAGETLVRIDPREAELLLAQRTAERRELEGAKESEEIRARFDREALVRERELLEIAERGLRRAQNLRERDLGSETDVDTAREALEQASLTVDNREQAVADAPMRMAQAEARLERARAAEDQARIDLERTMIAAPFDARVVEVEVAAGERARPGDPLVRLFALDDLEIRASIPAYILPRIEELLDAGEELTARAQVGGRTVRTELTRLEGETRAGEAGTRGIFEVREGHSALNLNRFVELTLRLPAEADSVAVPYEALYGRDQIFRVVDDRMQSLRVERLGEFVTDAGDVRALIRHPDLETGDILVATRLPNAVDGLKVEVEEPGERPDRDAAIPRASDRNGEQDPNDD
ncbi:MULTISPECIES: efflux RND transporter periplasmic adaptor subunit [unclassified Thioalkalivibrio]|uniref:efflux RND transporter periplasmic adaptor subunit n=1 Tax=unclassified Thioalkalivibrio TaxID=2621013 RepID=UPI00037035BA|nr:MULTISPECIES: HlyD family efflux transporter periplasmic adaptor subunit [unclassified Thioalkalivibrio]